MMALPRGRLLAAWGALARQAGTAPHAVPARCGALRALSSETELPAAAPAPSTKARPMPDATELRRQMVAYKTQVHELRLQYQQELKGKEAAKKAARLAAATATRHDDAVQKKDRAERAAAKKARLQERVAELQAVKAEKVLAGAESFKAAASKREEKYLGKFSSMALEAKGFAADEDAVEALIQDALLDAQRPLWRMPVREHQSKRDSSGRK